MLAEEHGLENAIQRWRVLSAGDRNAILQRLSSEQRLAFMRLLAENGDAASHRSARAQRFSAYSPWLANLIEHCEDSAPTGGLLTANVGRALLAAHEEFIADGTSNTEGSLLSCLFRRFANWVERLR
jgi:hypothetical protein